MFLHHHTKHYVTRDEIALNDTWSPKLNFCGVIIFSFIHSSMALQPIVGPWRLLQFRNLFFTQSAGLLGRVISPL
jgi:hypothetical protein